MHECEMVRDRGCMICKAFMAFCMQAQFLAEECSAVSQEAYNVFSALQSRLTGVRPSQVRQIVADK